MYVFITIQKKFTSNFLPLEVRNISPQNDQISYDCLGKFTVYNLFINQFQCRKINIREIKENNSHTTSTESISPKIK